MSATAADNPTGPPGQQGRDFAAFRATVVGLLGLHALLLGWGAAWHSPLVDESAHLAAGVSHWATGSFDLYRVNPPLVRMLGTLPVVLCGPRTDWHGYVVYPLNRSEFEVGIDFAQANRAWIMWYFTMARWACIPLSLVGGIVCLRWATELYGRAAGLLALALWTFCPNVLAHGQAITPDLGATALGVAAMYLFWRWLSEPGWRRAWLAGAVLGFAELAKFTLVVFYPLVPLLWIACRRPRRDAAGKTRWLAEAGQLALLLLLSLVVINAGYGFEDPFRRLGDFAFESRLLGGVSVGEHTIGGGNRLAHTPLASLPVPLPRNYLQGIDVQQHDFDQGAWSYLCGQWKHGGWWYFYLVGLGLKVPLGTWLLGLVALGLVWLRRGYAASWRDEVVLLAPAAAVLVLVSAHTGFSHHLRYVLPAFPFAYVWISKAARARCLGDRGVARVATLCLVWSVASSLWIYPHSLSYFNEVCGGPTRGHACLLDSNLDWGQDLLYLKRWMDAHPEARPLNSWGLGAIEPSLLGLAIRTPGHDGVPEKAVFNATTGEPEPGWYALSVTRLTGRAEIGGRFLPLRPVARVGYSILIYHVEPDSRDRPG